VIKKLCVTVALIILFTATTTFATSVNFSQSTYSVGEDNGSVQPVLVLSNPSMTDITVEIEYINGATTGMLFLILQVINFI